jgi:hypothetical protein
MLSTSSNIWSENNSRISIYSWLAHPSFVITDLQKTTEEATERRRGCNLESNVNK